ncbi:alpha-acetolactate decarboxylase [Paucilactobacillus hokkaidonensis JCM 18461]|uniref:Alpha-acetolactate decarboxylase n=2 Tax=Paucilactobacillus hokkaidonensis TaxID=1193095 RepID=A0A0A1GY51_9LACO|nr:acetolactate decarboxylase [Paucilactobacillus hokkaidonensis]KRO10093.1 acetolactate decarboxylase [Paucilactobacillus hokkaidonensis]BAP85396.1 alpha-acetolactate decarboxylase [Paucilactobacillus hokkaidonensis JCM 18461]
MRDTITLYQHGTLAMLVAGLFEGTLPLGELLEHGDTGIGTADSLDGEMVIVDGQAYKVQGSGKVVPLTPDTKVPFASVHFMDAQETRSLVGVTDEQLKEQLQAEMKMDNVFVGVRIDGTFSHMHTRAVNKQVRPFPNLTAATRVQPEFEQDQVSGSVVGYFSPHLFQGATVGGFHWHFINTTRDFGGHILDFTVNQAEISVQVLENMVQHLPITNTEFRAKNMALDSLNKDIDEAEH